MELEKRYLDIARKMTNGDMSMLDGCDVGNSTLGALLSIKYGIPRQYSEQYAAQIQYELLTEDLDAADSFEELLSEDSD